MPTCNYVFDGPCPHCGTRFVAHVADRAKAIVRCPACGCRLAPWGPSFHSYVRPQFEEE